MLPLIISLTQTVPMHRRRTLSLFLVLCVLCSVYTFIRHKDKQLDDELTLLAARLQYLTSMHHSHHEDVMIFASQLQSLLSHLKSIPAGESIEAMESLLDNTSIYDNTANLGKSSKSKRPLSPSLKLSSETLHLIQSFAGLETGRGPPPIHPPSIYYFLPHLLNSFWSLRPAYYLSRGRTGVTMVLGIPTVKRMVKSYLLLTIENVIENLSPTEAEDTLIIVFIGETDQDYVLEVSKQIENLFTKHIESGLLEIISPPFTYYPNLDNLRLTLDDTPSRVKWRAKQNLDYAFLMMYSQTKGTFYTQLEDDIVVKKGFLSTMKNYALSKISQNPSWFVIEFSRLGFIGKMFKCADLPNLIQFFIMFFNDKPVDWLLVHFASAKICNIEKDNRHCKRQRSKIWLEYKPPLFQHVGLHSSLKGKLQKLRDKKFRGNNDFMYVPHGNPRATVVSTIAHYKLHSLRRAYSGDTYFWGLLAHAGDSLEFIFTHPIEIGRYLFRSGNIMHPYDRFSNTTVEVYPNRRPTSEMNLVNKYTSDGFVIIGEFNGEGVARGSVDPKLGLIQRLRLHVLSDLENWVILSEIHIVPFHKTIIPRRRIQKMALTSTHQT